MKYLSTRYWKTLLRFLFVFVIAYASTSLAANCSPATSAGNAPADWQTYCWIDFSSYNDTIARSAAGQNFSLSLTDGSTLAFIIKVTGPANPIMRAVASPSWTGAAVGNSSFIGIPNSPVLYTVNSGVSTVTMSSITLTPPPGVPTTTLYNIVAADAESTDNAEGLGFVTNGGNWSVLDIVPPISGAQYPPTVGAGTNSFSESGGGLTGNVGGYIVGTTNPTTLITTLTAGGLQAAMFAVRFASIRLSKAIVGARAFPADQFTFRISATASGTVFGTATTSGSGNGPFTVAAASLSSGVPLTISEIMAAGSTSTLSNYSSKLTCTNGAVGSNTPLPNNLATTSYSAGPLSYGDALQCVFTNAAFPRITLTKALASNRVFAADQFSMNILNGAATVGTVTTTGAGSTVSTPSTPSTQVIAGTAYSLTEASSGSTNLTYYNQTIACTNAAAASATTLPTTTPGSVTPILGDNISCTIMNTANAPAVTINVIKTVSIISDPINGTTNPKYIPGAVLRYSITVTNTGTRAVDANSIIITDPLPTALTYYASTTSGPPVTFVDGTPASGLTYNYATNVSYSTQASGGAPYTYSPVPDTNGYDAGVKGLRIAPTGVMGGATASGLPSFTVSFLERIN